MDMFEETYGSFIVEGRREKVYFEYWMMIFDPGYAGAKKEIDYICRGFHHANHYGNQEIFDCYLDGGVKLPVINYSNKKYRNLGAVHIYGFETYQEAEQQFAFIEKLAKERGLKVVYKIDHDYTRVENSVYNSLFII